VSSCVVFPVPWTQFPLHLAIPYQRELNTSDRSKANGIFSCPSPGPEGPEYNFGSGLLNELAEPILGRVIGKRLHEWVELSMTPLERSRLGGSFHPWFREFWAPIADLMLVSSAFHDIVSRLVRIAFGIRVPLVQDGINERLGFACFLNGAYTSDDFHPTSLVHQVYNKLRSLFYFGSAVLCDAFQAPSASWEPLMNAYGNYMIALKYRLRRRSPGSNILSMDMTEVFDDLHVHLHLCRRQDLPIFLAEDLVHAVGQILEER
jgi:hypothetical protein